MDEKEFVCNEKCPHYYKIEQVKKEEPSFDEIMEMADMFKLFSDRKK